MQAARLTRLDGHAPHVNNDIIQLFGVITLALHPNTTNYCMAAHECGMRSLLRLCLSDSDQFRS